MILQTEQATGILSQTAQAGLAFGVLVVVILVLGWVVFKLWKESKEKSIEHGKTLAVKDAKIEALNDQIRDDAIEVVGMMKDLEGTLKELITELKIRNNA